MVNTTNTMVSNPKPLFRETFPGYKRPRIEPDIHFWTVEGNDNSDSGDEAVIHVKIDKSRASTKKYLKRITFPVNKSFYYQKPRVVRMLRKIMVRVFEHLGITNWRGIYQRWMYVEQVLKGSALTKFRVSVLACEELVRDESGYQWGIGKP